jgi:cell division protein FtsQ
MPARMQDRPGRWKLISRRLRQLQRPAMLGAAALIVLLGASAALMPGGGDGPRQWFGDLTAGFGLRVQDIRIEGRQKTPEGLLTAALGLHRGDPILGFSVVAARQRIETIAWVRSATVERRLPGTVVVQLVERSPFAVWQNDGKFALVDRDGNIVTDSEVATFADQLPLVVGPGAPKAAAALLDLVANYPEIQSRMVAAVRIGERRWNLHMKNGADVLLPEGAEAAALARLDGLQAKHALLDRPLQTVDMRLPDRLVIRPAVEKPQASRKPA